MACQAPNGASPVSAPASPPSYAECTPALTHPSLTARPFSPWYVHIRVSTHLDTHPSPSCQFSGALLPTPARPLASGEPGLVSLGAVTVHQPPHVPLVVVTIPRAGSYWVLTGCQSLFLGPLFIPFISQVPAYLSGLFSSRPPPRPSLLRQALRTPAPALLCPLPSLPGTLFPAFTPSKSTGRPCPDTASGTGPDCTAAFPALLATCRGTEQSPSAAHLPGAGALGSGPP